MSEIDDLLKSFGMDEGESNKDNFEQWYDLIRPTTVNMILGKKGGGKSGLGFFLLEHIGSHYGLSPFIVNLPRERATLMPSNFGVINLDQVNTTMNSIILIDEGTTMLPAGQAKLEEMVKAFQALSRQRNQLIIFIFHASSDIGSRILRGVDAVLLKEPSKRQIQHGSKDNWWHSLLVEAKGQFKTVADMGEDKRKYTFVDCEEPEFHGLVANPLCTFWSEDLSCAYAGVVQEQGNSLVVSDQLKLSALLQRQDEDEQSNTMKRLSKLQSMFPKGIIPFETIIDYDRNFNQGQLQQMCRERGLPIGGDKKKLAARIIADEQAEKGIA